MSRPKILVLHIFKSVKSSEIRLKSKTIFGMVYYKFSIFILFKKGKGGGGGDPGTPSLNRA